MERLECQSDELSSNVIVLASSRPVTWGRLYQDSAVCNVRRSNCVVNGPLAEHQLWPPRQYHCHTLLHSLLYR